MPLSHPPGHAQCDFGEALVIIGGVEQKAHCFVLDLPHIGCIATVYQFADGSVAYFALDAPAWREADEIAGRALLAIKPLTTVFST